MNLELRPLRHFEAVHRLRSFRLAADEQAVTQSAITKSLQKLEAELGLRLFDRTTRTVVPTPAGEALIGPARALLHQADELGRNAGLLAGGEAGAVKVGAMPHPTESLVAPALPRFVAERPDVEVELVTAGQERLVEGLLGRELDFVVLGGIAFAPIAFEDEIAIQRLPAEPAVLVARTGHPLVRTNAEWTEYLGYPWAVPRLSAEDYSRLPEPFGTEIRRAGIPQLKLESVSACLQLVEGSDVLTGVPRSVAERAVARGGLVVVEYPFALEARYALLSRVGRTLGEATDGLREVIRGVAREVAGG